MADSAAERNRRSRAHRRGDHSLCTARCAVVRAGGSASNGVPDGVGPIGAAVTDYVESLRLDGSDTRAVMAQCCQRLAQAFDTVPTRDIPSVSRELRTSLSWLAEAAAGVDGLAEIRSRRLLRRTDSILSEVDRQRALHRVAEFEDEGA